MPLSKEFLGQLSLEELLAVRSAGIFKEQDILIIEALQQVNDLETSLYREVHQDKGCFVIPVFNHSEPSGFIETQFFTEVPWNVYRHYCRNHGRYSSLWADFKIPDQRSTLPMEGARFDFINHIISKKPNSVSSIMNAWRKYQRFMDAGQRAIKTILMDPEERSLLSTPEDVQLCIDCLQGSNVNSDVLNDVIGKFTLLVFGTDRNYGDLVIHLNPEDKRKALLFCKDMLPYNFSERLSSQLQLLELN